MLRGLNSVARGAGTGVADGRRALALQVARLHAKMPSGGRRVVVGGLAKDIVADVAPSGATGRTTRRHITPGW